MTTAGTTRGGAAEALRGALRLARLELRAPSRTPRAAVVVGRLLAAGFVICLLTGLYSHFQQDPLSWMHFPTRPVWLYSASQGLHILTGLLCIPLLLAKLYTVYPRLFAWPPIHGVGHLLERLAIAVLVGASLVQLAIGLINTYQWYAFPFSFRPVHYALSYVIIGALAVHIGVKLPVIARNWRARSAADDDPDVRDGDDVPTASAGTGRGTGDGDGGTAARGDADAIHARPARGLVGRVHAWIDGASDSAEQAPLPPQRTSRRGFLVGVGASAGVLALFTAGQSFGALAPLNLLGPRVQGDGPQALPVNRTAREAKVLTTARAADWTLTVASGQTERSFTLDELRALPQTDVHLPIACVEGWTTWADWRGPRLMDLLDAVGAPAGATIRARSLEQRSSYAVSTMGPEFARDPLTLVALQLNGNTLRIDHGYPARIIAPGRPGVLQTKWLTRIEVV